VIPARAAASVDPVKALQKGRNQALGEGESRLRRWVAFACAAAVAGGSAYETFVLLPAWDVGTPGGSAAGGGAGALSLGRALGQFWLACYTAGAASLLLALVFNWRWNWRRAMVLLALLGFVTLRAWMYFSLRQDVDSLLSVAGGPPAAAGLVDHVAQWSAHHRWREVIDGLVAASLAMAFAVPARILSKTVARAAGIHRRASRESPR